MIRTKDIWNVTEKLFEQNSLVRHQIDSFNYFVSHMIQDVVDDIGGIVVPESKLELKFGKISISSPSVCESDGQTHMLLPSEARLRNLSYSSSLYIDVTLISNDKETLFDKCFLGKLPIMVGSKYCNLKNQEKNNECEKDHGGYFIINGSEKVVIAQEKMNNNNVYVFAKSNSTKYIYEAELRSLGENEAKSTSTMHVYLTTPNAEFKQSLKIQLPFLKQEVPALIPFLFLGVDYEDIEEIVNTIKGDKHILQASLEELREIVEPNENPMESILNYLQKKQISNYINIEYSFKSNFISNISNNANKIEMLKYIFERLFLCNDDVIEEDDRDHIKNKRIDLVGFLCAGLFRQLYKKTHKGIQTGIIKNNDTNRIINISHLLKTKHITNGLKYSLATGNWGVGVSTTMRTGVSQVLNRHTYISTISHMRRINSPMGREGKMVKPRQLHGTHAFRICPAETPEGAGCGLLKNMALSMRVTLGGVSLPIRLYMEELGCNTFDKHTKIFLNGEFIGTTDSSKDIVNNLKRMKLNGTISYETGIAYDYLLDEIRIYTDAGRCTRPLLVVKDNKLVYKKELHEKKSFNELVECGVVEYVDADEEETILIAMKVENLEDSKPYTHCEIHPCLMFGVAASLIPFPDRNQSPRNIYEASMAKQSIGVFATNYQERMDSYGHIMFYPQKPLVSSRITKEMDLESVPSGINAIVAVSCYTGLRFSSCRC